jgi:hypothetical protein
LGEFAFAALLGLCHSRNNASRSFAGDGDLRSVGSSQFTWPNIIQAAPYGQ